LVLTFGLPGLLLISLAAILSKEVKARAATSVAFSCDKEGFELFFGSFLRISSLICPVALVPSP